MFKKVLFYAIYTIVMTNVYIWLINPTFFYGVMIKWSLFFIALIAPMFYMLHKSTK